MICHFSVTFSNEAVFSFHGMFEIKGLTPVLIEKKKDGILKLAKSLLRQKNEVWKQNLDEITKFEIYYHHLEKGEETTIFKYTK